MAIKIKLFIKQKMNEQETDDIYAPVHDYNWAQEQVKNLEHCICSSLPGWHLVNGCTLRRYSQSGMTIETIEPTFEAMNSHTWRVWDWKGENNAEVQN